MKLSVCDYRTWMHTHAVGSRPYFLAYFSSCWFDLTFRCIQSYCTSCHTLRRLPTSERTWLNLCLAPLHLPAGADCRTKGKKSGHSDSTLRVSQVWKRDLTGCDSLKLCLSSHLICDCCLFSVIHLVSRCVFTVKDFTSHKERSITPWALWSLQRVPESKVGKLQIRDVN